MPEVSLSALELERKLKREEAERWVKHAAALEAEVAKLEAVAAAGPAAGGSGPGLDDKGKARLELLKRLVKGEKGAEKLKERAPFNPGSPQKTGSRASASVLFHPLNLRKAMG